MPNCYQEGCPKEATRLYEKEWARWDIEPDGNYKKSSRKINIEIPSESREEFHLCAEHGDSFERGELIPTKKAVELRAESIMEK